MLEALLLDPLFDSLKVFGALLIFHIILSFFEGKISYILSHHQSLSPLLGSLLGLIPQCGVTIVAADMYIKHHITMGTIVAVFIACSDEALPLLFTSAKGLSTILPLILIKIILGFSVGYLTDLIFAKKQILNLKEEETDDVHIGCCHHEIDNEHGNKLKEHLLHPLIHSLKTFFYVFVINIIFAFIIYFIGEDVISSFLTNATYFSPLFSIIIGLIPNCASSVILTNLYLQNCLNFGSLLSGLIVNAGLGMVYLLKSKEMRRNIIYILIILILTAIIAGYAFTLIYNLIR